MDDRLLNRHELGFLELANKPTQDELSRYYAEYYQNERGNYRKHYSELEHSVMELRLQQRTTRLFQLLGRDTGSLLDVGCGEGFVLNYFRKLNWRISGLDFTDAGVRQMNPDCLPFVKTGDVFQLLTEASKTQIHYEAVWLSNVLEHVLDPVALMTELKSLVLKDGVLVVTVPNDGTLLQEVLLSHKDVPNRFWIAQPDHISYFTKETLENLATKTGWACLAMQADFPVDWFLMNKDSNYITDRSKGASAHNARLRLEKLIGNAGATKANRFYESLADIGMGRNLTAFMTPAA
jgi:2-polyprenyl-3-methyl-5-hydroxy-6-metoxy-1,4-benzoquinol methylase